MLRRAVLALALVVALVAAGGRGRRAQHARAPASGPTSVTGTEATGVFQIADRTIRQVRYDDRGTLRYTFRLTNDGRLPLTVLGLAARPAGPAALHARRTVRTGRRG